MIQLDRTRAELMAEIAPPDGGAAPLDDLTDPNVTRGDARVRIVGHSRDDLFPLLEVVLSERYAAVPRTSLLRDLLIPLRNALGNAWKHGNGGDLAKTVLVDVVLTGGGALIVITDEGPGFDVAATYQRYKVQEAYFKNHGCGFRNLDWAASTVTFESSGRTLLLCYRPIDNPVRASAGPIAAAGAADNQSLSRILAELSALPLFANGGDRHVSWTAYPTPLDSHGPGHRYAVRVAHPESGSIETRVVAGRLHVAEDQARADFTSAVQLLGAGFAKRMRIPRPLARLVSEPCLVLYDFDPWMNLWEYLACRRNVRSVRHFAERVAQTLTALHKSCVAVPNPKRDAGDRLDHAIARAEATVQAALGSDCLNRLRDGVQSSGALATSTMRPRCPIHGSLSWDCIHFGIDGKFYLSRFETCRRSDPGLDLGGFVADLMSFTLARFDASAYRLCRDAFLAHYNAGAGHPMNAHDLRFYTVLALCDRLQPARPGRGDGQPVSALDFALRAG